VAWRTLTFVSGSTETGNLPIR